MPYLCPYIPVSWQLVDKGQSYQQLALSGFLTTATEFPGGGGAREPWVEDTATLTRDVFVYGEWFPWEIAQTTVMKHWQNVSQVMKLARTGGSFPHAYLISVEFP